MAGKKRFKKLLPAALIIVLTFAGVGLMHVFNVFDNLEYKAYDFRVKLFADSYKPSDDIMVILLDQNSIDWANEERGWGWPWPRKAYADLLDYMNQGGAKSTAFDILFSEPSIYRSANQDEIIDMAIQRMEDLRLTFVRPETETAGPPPRGEAPAPNETQRRTFESYIQAMTALRSLSDRADDEAFARASQNYGKAVQTVFFSTQTGNSAVWPGDLQKPLFSPIGFESIISNYSLMNQGAVKAQFPIPELTETAGALGNVTNTEDPDGINRRARLFINFDGKAVPGLSAASLLVSGQDTDIRYNKEKRQLEWGEYVIPIDSAGRSILRFRGSINRYMPYSAADILKSAEALAQGNEPLYHPDEFKDKYVFFGFYAPGLFDICSTPLESVYPGMGVHITMLDNLLNKDFIRETHPWVEWCALFGIILLTVLLVLFCEKLTLSVGGTLIIAGSLVGGALIAYNSFCLWFPLVLPLSGMLASFITCNIYNYATEGSQKKYIKGAFGQYLSPVVIEQIIEDPSNLELGGKSLDMTAIFTDIQKFSSISEALQKVYGKDGPKELVNLLNLYLTQMSNIALENQGTIDKFEGDAIIAFFGAPVPTEQHAAQACRTALQMKKSEKEITGRIMDQGGRFYPVLKDLIEEKIIRPERPLYTRIGINSGEMVVGNMGTPSKMNYTIMGNAVNLAARLEGVNKQYDTGGILLSEYTRDKINDEFILRSLSRVRVVGISTPVRLYELLDFQKDASPALLEAVRAWEAALGAYEGRDFSGALAGFEALCRANSDDLTARLYRGRCEGYLKTPPSDAEWDNGVDNLVSK
ncbi:MAG: adenylate/guanylate cyclase domain-containing protein [Spirochaetaceae bacterium]|jgi:adenylate cyclase|nr:adenylate/guanylate cyclase domain-containing protein [Spirochaetaceae bacterium]